MKKLYKSETDKKLCGVCGGIAEYFNIDSTVIRLIWAILILWLGTGILAYILAALIMPDRPPEE
ncbi:MAG: PspC domain-containing protein [Oscillospiraceae bacterium]|nr:PspC domain-containing protein [Oscillospiraceae bacterium]